MFIKQILNETNSNKQTTALKLYTAFQLPSVKNTGDKGSFQQESLLLRRHFTPRPANSEPSCWAIHSIKPPGI